MKKFTHQTEISYDHDTEWQFVEWDKKKFTTFSKHYTVSLTDINDPEGITVFLGDEKGGIFKKGGYGIHNSDEIVMQVVEGHMPWWIGPDDTTGKLPGQFPGEEEVMDAKLLDGCIIPAGRGHGCPPVKEGIPENVTFLAIYTPPRGNTQPLPEKPGEAKWIEFTEHSFGEKGFIKYFDVGYWRITYFEFKDGFLPKKAKALAQNDFDTYVFGLRGQFEFWFDPDKQVEKATLLPWEGIYIPSGMPYYGRQLGDWMGAVVTKHNDTTVRKLEIQDWEKVLSD